VNFKSSPPNSVKNPEVFFVKKFDVLHKVIQIDTDLGWIHPNGFFSLAKFSCLPPSLVEHALVQLLQVAFTSHNKSPRHRKILVGMWKYFVADIFP